MYSLVMYHWRNSIDSVFYLRGENKMIKKIIVTLFVFLSMQVTAFAVSLNELDNSPQKYVKVFETRSYALVVDAASINIVRETPPYYTLQANEYLVDYASATIAQYQLTVTYDYQRSTQGLIKLIYAQTPKITKEIFLERYAEEAVANCGMTYSSKISSVYYDFNGRVKHDHPSYVEKYNQRIRAGSDIFDVSNYMFKKQYGVYFLRPSTTAKA